jgi:TPR repeat protein
MARASNARSLRARYAEARWRIFRARSHAEFARFESVLREVAAAGEPEAWYVLFDAYRARKNHPKARECAERVLELGNEDDRIALALDCIYSDRTGTRAQQRRRGFDPKLGLRALETRARAGELASMYWLAHALRFGGPVRRDVQKSLYWTRRAARAGDVDSMTNLGVRYRNGDGVRTSARPALRWYRAAEARGCPSATGNLGRCYLQGFGVEKDERAAMRWFEKAARRGLDSAAAFLADARIDGRGVRADPRRGKRELRKLAASGEPHAVEMLAERLIEGRGVRRDARRGRRMLARLRREERACEGDFYS